MKSKETNPKRALARVRTRAARRPPSRKPDLSRLILQATTEFYGTWRPSAGPIHFDRAWRPLLGYSDEHAPRQQMFLHSFLHPDDRARFETQLYQYAADKIPALECEYRLRTKTGSFRWFEMRGQAIRRDCQGAAVEIAYTMRDIHARKQEQDAILASCVQLEAIFDASHDCVSVVDPVEFRLLAFNKAFADLIFRAHGIRIALGMRVESIAPTAADVWNAFHRQAVAEGKLSREYQVPGLNETHHVFAQTLLRDGKVYAICVFGHDITSQKQMETALRRSEEKFSKAFREAPFPVSLSRLRDDRYLDVNEAFVEESGYSREELIGTCPYDIHLLVHPEHRAEAIKRMQEAGEVRNVNLAYRTKSGDIREAIASAALIELEAEPCMIAVMMDVTERRRAMEALRESEERLRIAIEAGHMYAFEWNVVTDQVERAKQSHGMLGLPNGGSVHSKQELIDRILPEDRPQYVAMLKALTPQQPDYKTVFRLQHHDGRTIWLEESGRAVFGPDGELRKVIGITSDVTEIRQSERTLRELSGRLITSQEEERRRIARELHDQIGQEVALLCVQAQRLDSGAADEEHTMHSDAHELYKRVKVLAGDISKLSHRLHSSELSFLGLTVAAERLCRDFAHQYGIDVDFQPKALPPEIDSIRSLTLYRVLQEALQNAGKHSCASQVTVELQGAGDEIALRVCDNGVGFDIAKTGPGLGLLSMRERLNYVGGRFAIASKPGSGTRVTANLPAQVPGITVMSPLP